MWLINIVEQKYFCCKLLTKNNIYEIHEGLISRRSPSKPIIQIHFTMNLCQLTKLDEHLYDESINCSAKSNYLIALSKMPFFKK